MSEVINPFASGDAGSEEKPPDTKPGQDITPVILTDADKAEIADIKSQLEDEIAKPTPKPNPKADEVVKAVFNRMQPILIKRLRVGEVKYLQRKIEEAIRSCWS